jgi:TatA/E family protein of Tat protein translocase
VARGDSELLSPVPQSSLLAFFLLAPYFGPVVSLDSLAALTYDFSERLTLFSGGFAEIGFILFIAFLLFGPKKLPEIARTLGKGLGELRRASNELKSSLEEEIKNLDRYPEGPGDPSPKYGHNDSAPTPKEPGQ